MPQYPYNTAVGSAYQNIHNAGTTVVKSAPGVLHSIALNGGASAATVTLFDNTAASGTAIAQITLGAAVTAPMNPVGYGVNFNTGLVAVATGTIDLTLSYT